VLITPSSQSFMNFLRSLAGKMSLIAARTKFGSNDDIVAGQDEGESKPVDFGLLSLKLHAASDGDKP